MELYRDGVSKPLCCSVTDDDSNGVMSVPMSTTICRQLGYTTGKGTCIDNAQVRYTHTVHTVIIEKFVESWYNLCAFVRIVNSYLLNSAGYIFMGIHIQI